MIKVRNVEVSDTTEVEGITTVGYIIIINLFTKANLKFNDFYKTPLGDGGKIGTLMQPYISRRLPRLITFQEAIS